MEYNLRLQVYNHTNSMTDDLVWVISVLKTEHFRLQKTDKSGKELLYPNSARYYMLNAFSLYSVNY